MVNVFDKGEPLHKYASHKFGRVVYDASSVHNIGVDLHRTVADWESSGFIVRVLKVPKEKIQILYIRQTD